MQNRDKRLARRNEEKIKEAIKKETTALLEEEQSLNREIAQIDQELEVINKQLEIEQKAMGMFLKYPKCKNAFDKTLRIPSVLIRCGHTYCRPCVFQLIRDKKNKFPKMNIVNVECPDCCRWTKLPYETATDNILKNYVVANGL